MNSATPKVFIGGGTDNEFYDEQIKAAEMTDEMYIKMITVLQMLYGKLHEGYMQMYETVNEDT